MQAATAFAGNRNATRSSPLPWRNRVCRFGRKAVVARRGPEALSSYRRQADNRPREVHRNGCDALFSGGAGSPPIREASRAWPPQQRGTRPAASREGQRPPRQSSWRSTAKSGAPPHVLCRPASQRSRRGLSRIMPPMSTARGRGGSWATRDLLKSFGSGIGRSVGCFQRQECLSSPPAP